MITLNVVGQEDQKYITGSANGTPYSITYSVEKLKELEELVEQAEMQTTPADYKVVVEAFLVATKEDFHAKTLSKIPGVYFNAGTQTYHLQAGVLPNLVMLEDAMPQVLVERLLYSVEQGIAVDPIIKFYTRLLRNPNYSAMKADYICWYVNQLYTNKKYANELVEKEGISQEAALERATAFQTPITQEGLLATYKYATIVDYKYELDEKGNKQKVDRFAVTKTINPDTGEVTTSVDKPEYAEDYLFLPPVKGTNGDAFFCGSEKGHFIKVGQVHMLENWSQVNTNDHASCVPGLHVGNQDYVKGYNSPDRKLLEVFVDPANIGAVVQSGDGALRVKEYFVYNIHDEDFQMKSIYHSSEYAKRTDEQWENDRKQIIEELTAKAAKKAEKATKEAERLTAI